MFLWNDTNKLCNPNARYESSGVRHTKVPADLYHEVADDQPPTPPVGFSVDEAFYRTEDWNTTTGPYIVWTPKSQDQLDAITLAKANLQAAIDAKAENAENATIKYLTTHTPAEIATYVQNNVTDLASAKVVITRLAIAIGSMLR